ncbi:(+)-neomenthol dehydrogenase-like [Vigna angularis]|uniref:(+)-neomenthol dehydrogenase-like n=1 Tax=Phaseolus angularis TaxID=3914 RepID=UPI0022B337C7|nr:(+)-neomenthol dehydrogenase-like [Vigna angularis]
MKQDFFLFGICKKLALNGIVVVLKTRNEKRGLEAMERLKEFRLSDFVVFHQLDVTDPSSVTSLSHFIKTRFGKLDILVNNAGAHGGIKRCEIFYWNLIVYQNYELAKECVETDFFGVERVTEALLSLVQLSTSPRIVNISSQIGLLKAWETAWLPEDLTSKTRAPWESDINFPFSSSSPAAAVDTVAEADEETKAFVAEMNKNWNERRRGSKEKEKREENGALYSVKNMKKDY